MIVLSGKISFMLRRSYCEFLFSLNEVGDCVSLADIVDCLVFNSNLGWSFRESLLVRVSSRSLKVLPDR